MEFFKSSFCSGAEKGVGDLSTNQVSKSPPTREETKRRLIQLRPCWQPFSCSRWLFVCTPKGTDWVDYGYGHSFSIFFFFIHYPHLNWLGEFTGKKNGRRILPLHFLWFGWGGSGFGDIYQFVIYLRRFFFSFFFSCLTKEKCLLILFHLHINIYIYIFFLRGSNGFPR